LNKNAEDSYRKIYVQKLKCKLALGFEGFD
jgi:hypothetical protein